MKTFLLLVALTFSNVIFANNVSEVFKKTNLEMLNTFLNFMEPDESPGEFGSVSEVTFSAVKPKTIMVNVAYFKSITEEAKEKVRGEYQNEVSEIARMLGVTGYDLKFSFKRFE